MVTERRTPDMLVVLDSDPHSLAPLIIAQRYAAGTVLLTSWDADPLEIEAVVQSSATAEPTISEALKAAAQRGMPWVGVRRNFAPPEQLLTELMIATARHSHDVVPGFAVFLADGDPAPFRHILAIVDRSDGPISGLLAYAAVAVADTAGAQLDILVIGDGDEDPHSEDELESLVISRERELYDAAVERARGQGVAVTWMTAASVKDLWRVISDQLSQHDYDLVIDDLGDVSLARLGMTDTAGRTLADGAAGEIPLKLLTQTEVPLLLVMDEIRLGLAPPALLKAGAMAAIAVGMVAAPMAAAAATPAAATASMDRPDPAGALIADLEAALAAEGEAEARRARAADKSGRGAGDDSARAQSEQVVTQPTAYAPQAAAVPAGTEESAATAEAQAKSEDKASSEPKPPKPPKGGATPSQVAKAKEQAAEKKAALEKDKAQKAKAKDSVAEAETAHTDAQAAAAAALTELQVATESHAAAADRAAEIQASAAGLAAMLPGAPTDVDVMSAQLSEQAAAERLAAAVESGTESLGALESAQQTLAEELASLDDRAADVQETKAEYQQSKEKAEVYKESLAETRQSPMAKGTYRLTARFGQTGGYWSSGVHTGLDFAGPTGTPILAAASGKVISSGYEGSYGNQVIIDHGGGYQTTYAHLSGINVSVGETVSTGDQVGRRGSTGNSTGAHLHFEVTKDGKFVDPEGWLGW